MTFLNKSLFIQTHVWRHTHSEGTTYSLISSLLLACPHACSLLMSYQGMYRN